MSSCECFRRHFRNGFEWISVMKCLLRQSLGPCHLELKILLVEIASVEIYTDVQCRMLFDSMSMLAEFSRWPDEGL